MFLDEKKLEEFGHSTLDVKRYSARMKTRSEKMIANANSQDKDFLDGKTRKFVTSIDYNEEEIEETVAGTDIERMNLFGSPVQEDGLGKQGISREAREALETLLNKVEEMDPGTVQNFSDRKTFNAYDVSEIDFNVFQPYSEASS